MSFTSESGYVPVSITEIMNFVRQKVNEVFGTDYTAENFVGSNWYKYCYVIAQRMQEDEVKTSEIFSKLQQYIALTNERIQRPSVSYPGLVDSFAANGYIAAVKQNEVGDAGTISIAVDVDGDDPDYADIKLEICTLIKDFVAAGTVTLGDETESIVLSNGQSFDFKYTLPDETPIILRLTIAVSENNQQLIPSDEDIRDLLWTRLNSMYKLGLNFEPQRYFTLADAPYAATVLLEWSDDDGENWHDEVFDAAFDDKLTFNLEDLAVIFA